MSKGPTPDRLVPRTTIASPPATADTGGGPERDSCAGPVELEFDVAAPAEVGLGVVVVPRGNDIALVAAGRTVGHVRASGHALLACVSWGWSYRGTITELGLTSGIAMVTGSPS